MALPTRAFDRGQTVKRHGVAFAVFPAGGKWATEVQRAPDSAGSPNVGSAVTAGYLSPGQQLFVDESIGSSQDTFHYRSRHVREGHDASDWTGWIACQSELLPEVLPMIPSEATKTADMLIDPSTGAVNLEVNGSPRVGSVIWDIDVGDVDDWPNDPAAASTYTVDTDSNGDVSIDVNAVTAGEPGGSRDAPSGQQARATLWFYAGANGTGQFLGSLRVSGLRGTSGAAPLAPLGVQFAVTWEPDVAAGPKKYKAHLDITVGSAVERINYTAQDAPVTVNVNTDVDLSSGEQSNRFVRKTITGFDADTSDGCIFTVTGHDTAGGGGADGDQAYVGDFVPQVGSDVNTSGIEALTNVERETPANLEILGYRSADSKWVNMTAAELGLTAVSALNDLSDVVITAAANLDVLAHNGSNWVDTALTAAHIQSGVLPTARGGTGQSSTNVGTILIGSLSGWDKLILSGSGNAGLVLTVQDGLNNIDWSTVSGTLPADPAAHSLLIWNDTSNTAVWANGGAIGNGLTVGAGTLSLNVDGAVGLITSSNLSIDRPILFSGVDWTGAVESAVEAGTYDITNAWNFSGGLTSDGHITMNGTSNRVLSANYASGGPLQLDINVTGSGASAIRVNRSSQTGADFIVYKSGTSTTLLKVTSNTDTVTIATLALSNALTSNYGGTGLTNSGITSGDIMHSPDGTSWTTLGIGATGEVLTVSALGQPEWAAAGSGLPGDPGAGDWLLGWDDTGNNAEWMTAGNGIIVNDGAPGNFAIDIDTKYLLFTATKLDISPALLGADIDLDGLQNVTVTGIASGEILKWSGSAWVNNTLAEAGISEPGHTHAASAVTSGTFADARIPSLAASKITSGTFADARISQSSVTQHEAALSIGGAQVDSGTLPDARLSANVAFTNANETWGANTVTAGDFIKSSDRALKENIRDLTEYVNVGAVIDGLRPRIFQWKATGRWAYGHIAQEVQSIDDVLSPNGKTVASMDGLFVAELQSLRRRVKELEAELAA